jgi:putative transposase
MPAREIQFVRGEYYHLYNRGAHRMAIFRKADNYEFVLRRMKQYATEFQITFIAYCLMPTHYHWLVRQDGDADAGLLPQRVFNSYTKAYNNAYNHVGTLFETRFKAKLIDRDEYLRHLCRYIHANPVRDGLALTPELWLYSNYLEWIGIRNGTLVDRTFVQSFFPDRERYKAFVTDYLTGHSDLPKAMKIYLANLST